MKQFPEGRPRAEAGYTRLVQITLRVTHEQDEYLKTGLGVQANGRAAIEEARKRSARRRKAEETG